MKKVISNEELNLKMIEAIKLLCEPVKKTLGPKGRNVIIDHSAFSPFITNDGVTIAENITSEDPVINTILELAKESSIKTNELIGDGTTTTLVLLESLYLNGYEKIKEGYNPLIFKQELNIALETVINNIIKESTKPAKKDLENIATISANSKKIGHILATAYKKVGKDNIYITESNTETTKVNHLIGYQIDCNIASPYYFKNNLPLEFENPKILLYAQELEYIEEISPLINKIIDTKNPLIIIAKDYNPNLINEVINLYLTNNIPLILLKTPYYGLEEQVTLTDLATISNTKVYSNLKNIDINNLGTLEHIDITKETVTFKYRETKTIKEYFKNLKKNISNKNEFDTKRLAMLNKGFIKIEVGAQTTTEQREKKMRYDDALCSLKIALKGVVPGSGLTLLKCCEKLNPDNPATIILKEALKTPLKQILENAALNSDEIINKIISSNYNYLYNVKKDTYEEVSNSVVIDSTEVVITALKNACSIAGLLLTTNTLIINEFNSNNKNYLDINEI